MNEKGIGLKLSGVQGVMGWGLKLLDHPPGAEGDWKPESLSSGGGLGRHISSGDVTGFSGSLSILAYSSRTGLWLVSNWDRSEDPLSFFSSLGGDAGTVNRFSSVSRSSSIFSHSGSGERGNRSEQAPFTDERSAEVSDPAMLPSVVSVAFLRVSSCTIGMAAASVCRVTSSYALSSGPAFSGPALTISFLFLASCAASLVSLWAHPGLACLFSAEKRKSTD